MQKKIVIIGPESTGKSTLCKELAAHYHTQWVPEYAREYLLQHGKNYSFEDLLTIAKGQLQVEDEISLIVSGESTNKESHSPLTSPQLLFIDTDMYVMKVWCEFVFGKCHQYIIDQIAARKYDLYLLCDVDLPWTKDELREYPDLETRQKLFHIYRDLLINQPTAWELISGSDDQRLEAAINAIEKHIPSSVS